MYFIKNGDMTRNRIVREITKETFFTILSHLSLDISFLTRFTKDLNASLNRNPPSSGTIGRTLNNPTKRLSQKIQYKAVTIIQKPFAGRALKGPVIL